MQNPRSLLAVAVSLSLAASPAAAQFRGAPARIAPLGGSMAAAALPGLRLSPAAAPSHAAPSAAIAAPAAASPEAVPAAQVSPAAEALSAAQRDSNTPFAAEFPGAVVDKSPERAKAETDALWTGAAEREGADAVAASSPSSDSAAPLEKPAPRLRKTKIALLAAGALAATAPASLYQRIYEWALSSPMVAQALPFMKAGGTLVATYYSMRIAGWGAEKIAAAFGAKKDAQAIARLSATTAVLGTGGVLALWVSGALPVTLGTALSTALGWGAVGAYRALNNFVHGVDFLLTSPYRLGQKIEIQAESKADKKKVGTITDLTLTHVKLTTDNGREIDERYENLAGKVVILHDQYRPPHTHENVDRRSFISLPSLSFKGALGSVWGSIDRRLVITLGAMAAAFAVPYLAPAVMSWIGTGLLSKAVAGAVGVGVLYSTRRVETVLIDAINSLAKKNGWSLEGTVLVRLVARVLIWTGGASLGVTAAGLSWAGVGATLGITAIGAAIASLPYAMYFASTFIHAQDRRVKVGQTGVEIGALDAGDVVGLTMHHVVLRMKDGRHIMVPYGSSLNASVEREPETAGKR